MAKYIFVTGGVVSSLGKGIISSSIGKLLQARGFKITIQKFDPYINIDPGTLNPYEHGECYVTVDGMETDLDLGHYERFTGIQTTRANSMTTGRIYKSVIDKERSGDTEIIPFTYEGGIDAFIRNEVHPYAPDAFVKPGSEKVGYELSFTKYFYKPVQLRTLDEIAADIRAIEKETDGLLDEIIGG